MKSTPNLSKKIIVGCHRMIHQLESKRLSGRLGGEFSDAVCRYPWQYRARLTALVEDFPEAADFLWTNPPLAVAHAATWDTLIGKWSRDFQRWLLRQRRRTICGELGFPATETVVRILAKIEPAACNVGLLMRLRRALRIASLRSILSHLARISEAELQLAGLWEDFPHASAPLFVELAGSVKDRNETKHLTLLRDCEELVRLDERALPRFQSLREMNRCHDRLVAERIRRDWDDPENDYFELKDLSFPSPPIPGTETIQAIESPAMLLDEACTLHHCAAIHAKRIAAGSIYFYRVLEPERATLSIVHNDRCWQIAELFGACNKPVLPATEITVRSWLGEAQFLSEPGVC